MALNPTNHVLGFFLSAGQSAVYTPPSGSAQAVHVMAQTKAARLPLAASRVYAERLRFHVARTELSSPVAGGTLVVGGTTYTLDGVLPVDGENDAYQTRWSLEVAWGPQVSFTPSVGTNHSAKTSGDVAKAATTITFNNLSTGLVATAVGDTFVIGNYSTEYVISNVVAAAAGALTGVTFAPGAAQAITSGATVVYKKKATATQVKALVANYAANEVNSTTVLATDIRLFILVDSWTTAGLTAPPAIGSKITFAGLTRTVKNTITHYYGTLPLMYEVQLG